MKIEIEIDEKYIAELVSQEIAKNSERYLEKCTCKIGQLVNSLPPTKKMCLNCLSYRGRFCTNAKQIEKVRKMVSQFEINLPKLAVKDPTGCCDEHELDYHIFGELIKDGKEKYTISD